MGKGESVFREGASGFRVFRDFNYKFHIATLIWRTIYEQTERWCTTCYFSLMFLAYFVLLKVFFNSLLLISYLRGKVYKS